jgi:hypothetical protein
MELLEWLERTQSPDQATRREAEGAINVFLTTPGLCFKFKIEYIDIKIEYIDFFVRRTENVFKFCQ